MNSINSKIKVITLLFGIILFCSINGRSAEKEKRFDLFVSSGVSFPSYPIEFARNYQPAFNAGCGLEWKLSSSFSIRGNYNYYCYYYKYDYIKYLIIGDSRFELPGKGTYSGNIYFAVPDIWIDLKYKFIGIGTLNLYVTGGGGLCYLRDGSYWETGIGTDRLYAASSLHSLFSGGLGVQTRIAKGVRLFVEMNYRHNFFKKSKTERGSFPLRIGISSRH